MASAELPTRIPAHLAPKWGDLAFDLGYLTTYIPELDPPRTEQEVAFFADYAGINSGKKVLDLACGHGRHANLFQATTGAQMTGIDISPTFLEKANEEADPFNSPRYIQGDMRRLPKYFKENAFDVIVSLFTSFGWLDNAGQNETLAGVAHVLRPNGTFVLDVIRGEAVQNRFNSLGSGEIDNEGKKTLIIPREYEIGGLHVVETEWYDPDEQLIQCHREWVGKNGVLHGYDYYLRVYTLEQYRQMFDRVGLVITQVVGDTEGNPISEQNIRSVIKATK